MPPQVLISRHTAWQEAADGEVPPEAIQVGQTSAGEPLYVGRTLLNGTLTIGKVEYISLCKLADLLLIEPPNIPKRELHIL